MQTFLHKVTLPILLIALSALSFLGWSPPPGLDKAEAIGPFINNNLPNQAPAGDIELVPTYSNIQWLSPIVALPFPGTNNMLVVEMDGRFFTLGSNEFTSNRDLVLDIQDRSWYYNWNANNNNTKHGGIQNVAFHPQFGTGQGKDYMYVYYVYNDNDASNAATPYYNRLSRFTWNGNSFNPNSELIMINQYDTAKGHDGSGLTFGNDGYLYVSVGDEGTQNGAATAHTQKLNDRFRSGVWRIDVDQTGGNTSHPIIRQPSNANVPASATSSYTQGYYIPNDNPWVNPDGSVLEEFYAVGLRQPFRMTNDIPTGNIWIGDVGGGQREEIDLLDAPGYNYEWNYKEGTANGFRDLPNPYFGTPRPPVHDYDRTVGTCVIGGYVYRGTAIPQLIGKYIYADNGTNGNVSALTHTAGNSADQIEIISTKPDGGGTFTGIGSFGYDHNNELFVLKLGTTLGQGKIYKLIENASTVSTVFPDKLSQTGVFSNLSNLTPVSGIIPYDVNNPLWSAGTDKKRWVAIPNDGTVNSANERITYAADGSWGFPIGTVFIKHFGQPDGKKLETRLWIHGADGKWFGTTYKWNNAGTDADLLLAGAEEKITIEGETFDYLYPSVTQCNTCHTSASGDVLGFRTHQLNRDIYYPTSGLVGNQLETFAQLGFIPNVNTNTIITAYGLADNSKSLELRVRSYFDSNCSHCHQPEANRAFFDARYTTPLSQQNLINGALIEDLGISSAVVIAPQQIDKSVLYQRVNSTDGCCAMPPLAKGRIDKEGVQLIANWINSIDADCSNSSSMTLGNTLSDGNFIDGHNPAMIINESDTHTNTSNKLEEVCIVDFNFYARRLGNPVTPFIAKVNGDNNFTILTIGQTRISTDYTIGNNSFPFTNHSDDVLLLLPGETIAIGYLDAFPDGSGAKIQSVIPAQQGTGEDEIWQTYTTNTNLPSLTVGKSPGLAAGVATNLKRSYKFNIGIEVSDVDIPMYDEITLFKNCNYGGTSISLSSGDYPNIAIQGFLANDLSSVKVPTNFEIILYEGINFGGNSITLTADNDCLTGIGFNDKMSSLKIIPTNSVDCSSPSNLAVGKTTTQSSTYANNNTAFGSANAVDGNNDGNHFANSMTHTINQQNAWWEVDLGATYDLSSVKIWNRTNCCAERLTDFHVLVSDVPFNSQALNATISQNGVGDFLFSGTAGRETNINLNRTGRYLRVQLSETNILQLAEVEIFGCQSDETSGCTIVTMPAKIEAEDYCDQSGVQAETTGDVGGGENIGFVGTGDWMEYQIQVPATGSYKVDYRVAAQGASGGNIQLQLNGNSIGSIAIPSTGAWQTYTTISNQVNLLTGTHTLRVFAQQAGWNLNWLEVHNWDNQTPTEEIPENTTTTASCDNGTSITYGAGTITMDGGSFYQILDANWQEVFNCGWQCGNSQTVDNLAVGDYRIYIKDDTYQNICEKVITLSAGGNNGGSDPVDEEEEEEEEGGGTTDTNTTCGEVAVTYGNGKIAVTGLPNKDYFFKVNDLDNGWADAGNCGWNCGNEFTVNNLSNGRYLLTVYNADWSPHCDIEITMTGSSAAGSATDRQAPHLSFAAYPANRTIDLQWLSNSGFKVRNFEIEHSGDGINFEQLAQFVNKEWATEIAYHQTTDETPLMGTNYYRVKEIYLDGSFAYTDVQQVNFQIDLDKVSVFPNPARDELFLNLNPYVGKKVSLSLVNHLGKQLIQQDVATVTTELISMNTTQIQNGLYYLILEVDGHKPFTKKILIHRLY